MNILPLLVFKEIAVVGVRRGFCVQPTKNQ